MRLALISDSYPKCEAMRAPYTVRKVRIEKRDNRHKATEQRIRRAGRSIIGGIRGNVD